MIRLILSDVHSNLAALKAVFKDCRGEWDSIICLGDLVGYGPHPEKCVQLIANKGGICLSGNHDMAVTGQLDTAWFNQGVLKSLELTKTFLSKSSLEFLSRLKPFVIHENMTLFHGSLEDPGKGYLLMMKDVLSSLKQLTTNYGFYGHTHVAQAYYLKSLNKQLFNPGSIGQPRDGDPRAAYALFNDQTGEWVQKRVAYSIEKTCRALKKRGFPEKNAKRLYLGE